MRKMSFEIGYTFVTESLTKNVEVESQLEGESQFEILNVLGKGGFGKVCHVKSLKTSEK